MKNRYFIFLTLIIGFISELVHPDMKTWVPVSVIAYIICGFFATLAIYFHKKDQRKFTGLVIATDITFTEYVIITAVAYLRMIDTIIADGPVAIVATTVTASIFIVVSKQWQGSYKKKK